MTLIVIAAEAVYAPDLRDESDTIILSCAIGGGADFIVSGDNHLLSLKGFALIPIVTPAQFLALLNPQPQTPVSDPDEPRPTE